MSEDTNAPAARIGKLTPQAEALPAASDLLCGGCFGAGTYLSERYVTLHCAECSALRAAETLAEDRPSYCPRHACKMCSGRGVVCRACHGMRFVAESTYYGNRAVPCPRCNHQVAEAPAPITGRSRSTSRPIRRRSA